MRFRDSRVSRAIRVLALLRLLRLFEFIRVSLQEVSQKCPQISYVLTYSRCTLSTPNRPITRNTPHDPPIQSGVNINGYMLCSPGPIVRSCVRDIGVLGLLHALLS